MEELSVFPPHLLWTSEIRFFTVGRERESEGGGGLEDKEREIEKERERDNTYILFSIGRG